MFDPILFSEYEILFDLQRSTCSDLVVYEYLSQVFVTYADAWTLQISQVDISEILLDDFRNKIQFE